MKNAYRILSLWMFIFLKAQYTFYLVSAINKIGVEWVGVMVC